MGMVMVIYKEDHGFSDSHAHILVIPCSYSGHPMLIYKNLFSDSRVSASLDSMAHRFSISRDSSRKITVVSRSSSRTTYWRPVGRGLNLIEDDEDKGSDLAFEGLSWLDLDSFLRGSL
jgi:hypothetical protein